MAHSVDPKAGAIKPGRKLGKYRVKRKLGEGGFATVYAAHDTIEDMAVALKVPHAHLLSGDALADLYREIRVTARLRHPNILTIKNADFIDERLVIAYELAEETLYDRLRRRISTRKALGYAEQTLAALAHAHAHRIMHRDVKPENLLLFDDDQLKLTDFGIAKVLHRTELSASASGTVGYLAPEQAMGRPSYRSDVFSAGLILYRMLTGTLPKWPFEWPLPGHDVLRRKCHPDLVRLLQRALQVNARARFRNAVQMLAAFRRVKPRQHGTLRRRRARADGHWKRLREREFRRRFGPALELRHACPSCAGPIDQAMRTCPWCGRAVEAAQLETRFPKRCRRCARGMKLDWRYCAWCRSGAQGPDGTRRYTDRRYRGRCPERSCRGPLLPFMRACPWCRTRLERAWPLEGSRDACGRCGWGVARGYWSRCPWCGSALEEGAR